MAQRLSPLSFRCGTTAQNPTPAQYTGTTAIAYAPQGAMQTLTRGDGLTESWSYNNRLQPASVSVGSGTDPRSAFGLDLYYCPGKAAGCATNNGNLATASLSILGVDQNFTYDSVNRVATAAEGTAWSQTYAYDRFGNRRVSAGLVLDPFTPTATTNFNTNNQLQIQNSGYDASGNLTHIGGYGFAWDDENRMVASAIGNIRTDYSYDGDGRRVMKQSDTGTTIFVYDVSGHLAAEYSTGANSPECTTCYLSADQLGSTRVVTDQNGGIVARHDYLPFGEEIPQQYSGRTSALHFGATENIAQKFTGKIRDQETGLDYFGARYYGSALGRFTSPDPLRASGSPRNPQSWNRYAYVLNNPLALIDPDGQCSAPAVQKGQTGVCIDLYIAAGTINGIGHGDNRGPAPNDPGATYRTEVQMALDPQKAAATVVKNDAGVSRAKLIGIPDSPAEIDIARKGTSTTKVSPVTTDDSGSMHFSLSNVGVNGLASLPGAPKDSIKTDLNFVFTPDGKVGLDPGGMRTAYPSLEIYSYDGAGKATTILQVPERNPRDLCCENQRIPAVFPR